MNRTRLAAIAFFTVSASTLLTPAAAQPRAAFDAEAAVAAEIEFRAWFQSVPRGEVFRRAGGEVERRLSGVDFETADAATLEALAPMLQFSDGLLDRAIPRLETLSEREDADGAVAATTAGLLQLMRTRSPLGLDRVSAIANHPGLEPALRDGRGAIAIEIVANTPATGLPSLRGALEGFEDVFAADDVAPEVAFTGPSYLAAMERLDTGIANSGRNEARRDVVIGAIRRSLAGLHEAGPDAAATRERLEMLVASMDGAFARGELVGFEAPEIEFLWSSDDALPESLGDLRGRVVVLDFWATWCGPCVASFPQVRDLVKHYEDEPVTVLGVTSLQGRHIAGQGDETVTAGDPDLEFRLMGEYVVDKDMTWPVVFSSPAVQMEYGVNAIPHVVLIDKAGKVRHRGLTPFMPKAEKSRLIDELLAEEVEG